MCFLLPMDLLVFSVAYPGRREEEDDEREKEDLFTLLLSIESCFFFMISR